MNPQDPLSQLKDIHLPAAGGFWPPAPGWWLLTLLALLLIVALVWLVRRRVKNNRWLKQARAELSELDRQARPDPAWFAQLNTLLKRAARQRYPERHPESLSGDAWIDFLLETAPGQRIASRPVVEAMVHSAWQPNREADPKQATRFAQYWLGGPTC